MDVPGSENVRLRFHFTDLLFVVCQSTVKTAKIRTSIISGYTVIIIPIHFHCKLSVSNALLFNVMHKHSTSTDIRTLVLGDSNTAEGSASGDPSPSSSSVGKPPPISIRWSNLTSSLLEASTPWMILLSSL